jgi:trimeric autotransporter adhesin
MAELNITNIPAPRVPFIDERTGLMAREWYRFFLNMFVLTGSGSNATTLDELQLGPPPQQDSGGVTSVSGTPPVVSSGGNAPVISMPAATTSADGYLTSTDWNTFNNKGTVSSVSVVSANGLAGTVATATTTPAVTLSTTVTGVLKGNGTAISAATSGTDYAPATSGASILYGNGAGGFSNVTIGTGVAFSGGTLSATGSGGTVTSVSGTAGRITSTGGTTPVIDLVSGIATAGTTGSALLIPVVTIDTYGRVTTITTAANPQGTVTSVSGTAPVVSSGGATPVISMAAATTSVNGYLTSTDWTTFNNKGVGSVTSVSVVSANGLAGTVATSTTTPAITLSTTVTGVVKGDGTALSAAVAATDYVAPSAYASANGLTMATARLLGRTTASTGAAEEISVAGGLTLSGGTLTGASGTVTSVTGTAPVVSSGGATPAISMAAATTSVNGYLTSTDWTTFNNKQPAGSYLVSGGALGTPSSGTVTNLTGTASININGTVGATTANTGAFTALSATGDISAATVSGNVVATQAQQETGTATNVLVTPGRQQFHPSAAKIWQFTTYSGGTPTLAASYNVSSITDVSTGQLTINFSITLSSASYPVVNGHANSVINTGDTPTTARATTSCTVYHFENGTPVDPLNVSSVIFGDQ